MEVDMLLNKEIETFILSHYFFPFSGVSVSLFLSLHFFSFLFLKISRLYSFLIISSRFTPFIFLQNSFFFFLFFSFLYSSFIFVFLLFNFLFSSYSTPSLTLMISIYFANKTNWFSRFFFSFFSSIFAISHQCFLFQLHPTQPRSQKIKSWSNKHSYFGDRIKL